MQGWLWRILGLLSGLTSGLTSMWAAPVDFARDVRPILSDKCVQCHGPDANDRQADLRLDDEQSAKADRGGYRVIAPRDDAAASHLLQRILSTDAEERMPPADSGKSLSAAEIETLQRWIEEGAVWQQHWAYVAPRTSCDALCRPP
jgi:mono/diheme cytochrome c family protein